MVIRRKTNLTPILCRHVAANWLDQPFNWLPRLFIDDDVTKAADHTTAFNGKAGRPIKRLIMFVGCDTYNTIDLRCAIESSHKISTSNESFETILCQTRMEKKITNPNSALR